MLKINSSSHANTIIFALEKSPFFPISLAQFTKHLALCGMAEFIFHLTRLEPDLLHVVRSTGCLTQTFLTFHINNKGLERSLYCMYCMYVPCVVLFMWNMVGFELLC